MSCIECSRCVTSPAGMLMRVVAENLQSLESRFMCTKGCTFLATSTKHTCMKIHKITILQNVGHEWKLPQPAVGGVLDDNNLTQEKQLKNELTCPLVQPVCLMYFRSILVTHPWHSQQKLFIPQWLRPRRSILQRNLTCPAARSTRQAKVPCNYSC